MRGIAHEIGNPLASLSSVAQYLGKKLKTHEEKEYLLVIRHQVNRISNILRRMLSLSRPATSEYKWVDVNELIDNTLSLMKFDKRMRSVTIKNIIATDLPMVWLNPQLLEQVLINIFINALISYNLVTEVDGTIALESEPGKGTTVIIRIPIRPKKDLIGGNDSREDFTNSAEAIKEANA
jgi:signal transduction histidine kinase